MTDDHNSRKQRLIRDSGIQGFGSQNTVNMLALLDDSIQIMSQNIQHLDKTSEELTQRVIDLNRWLLRFTIMLVILTLALVVVGVIQIIFQGH